MGDKPPCYGLYWEGIAGSVCIDGEEKNPGECSALNECLAKFASGKLIAYQRELGKEGATPSKLAKLASVSPEAILLAINFQNNAGFDPFKEKEPKEDEITDEEEKETGEETQYEPTEGTEEGQKEDTVEKGKTEKGRAKGEKKVNPVKRKPGRPKTKPPDDPVVAVNPPKARPVKSAKVLARKTRKSVKTAGAQAGRLKLTKEQKYLERWLRERERSPLIAKLTPGMKITRLWYGIEKVVIVRYGYYQYKGGKWPTLYMIMKDIAGTITVPKQRKRDGTRLPGTNQKTTQSAVRFFRLHLLV